MTSIGTKTWHLGGGRRGEADASRAPDVSRAPDEGKLLARSKASLAESERMLSRQAVLLAELRADGFATTEAEKSVARLEAAVLTHRAARDGLLAKARAGDEVAAEGGFPTN